jgi:hypothetical protein
VRREVVGQRVEQPCARARVQRPPRGQRGDRRVDRRIDLLDARSGDLGQDPLSGGLEY